MLLACAEFELDSATFAADGAGVVGATTTGSNVVALSELSLSFASTETPCC